MGELEATKVTPDTVQRAIMKLKEKSDGEALISDHLILAPTSFTKILASVVTSLLQHGHKHALLSTWTCACPVINMDTCMPLYQHGHMHALLSTWTHALLSTWTHACPVISVMLPFNRFQKVVARITLFPLIIEVLHWYAEKFLMVLN